MARGKGKGRGQSLSRQGEYSTSVESSSRFSQDMPFLVPAIVGTTTRRKGQSQTAKQYGSDDFSVDNYCDDRRKADNYSSTVDDTAADKDTACEKPELEAYCRGSWWDVEILKKGHDKYLVHYLHFSDEENEWVPLAHLRMRCRTSSISDCCEIHAWKDVCVMTRHPHSEDKSPAWFDAKVIDIERKPHTPKSCKCAFRIALYRIPASLSRDCRERTLLPISQNLVDWKKLSIMREARSMPFEEVVVASLPHMINTPRIWAKDGARWYSSFDYGSTSWDRSSSFESRGGIGSSLFPAHLEEYTPIVVPELKPFLSFLEEEDIIENPPTLSSDESDGDVEILSVIPGSKPQPIDYGPNPQPFDFGPEPQPIDFAPKPQPIDFGLNTQLIDSGSKVQLIDLDMDDVALFENDDMDIAAICGNDDMGYGHSFLDRDSNNDEYDGRATSPERPEDVLEIPNPTTSSESLGNPQADLDEVVLSEIRPLEPTEQSLLKPTSIPCVDTIPFMSVPMPPVEPATSLENSEGDDFAQLLEESIAGCEIFSADESAEPPESSDGDGLADYLERSIARNCGPKRSISENHGANPGAKRRRNNPPRTGRSNLKPPLMPVFRDKERPRPIFSSLLRPAQVFPRKVVKEKARVYEMQETISVTLASSPVKSGHNLDRSDSTLMEDAEMMLDHDSPPVAEILARSRDASKSTGLPTQSSLLKDKRPKRVGSAAVPKKVVQEITYEELFKSVEPVQCIIPSEQGPAEESSLLPSWNPFMESVGPDPLQEVVDDPFADVWNDMRLALESGNNGNDEVREMVEESIKFDDGCENSGGSECLEHTVEFDLAVGEVCGVCGFVLLGIQDIWARDNAKRIALAKEGDDEDIYGSDYGFAVWDSEDDKLKQQNNIEEGSNIELIPDLAKKMQMHQKQGFHFLWRNLAGQDSNGNPCFPQIEPGGCVLSHAPGTGKTFLIISFLQSYMKKYPDCRPIIVAPKIMLQPWEKEFRKWNVDIAVHNFSQACEQGKRIFQKHLETGVVQYERPKKNINIHREAMLWEWLKTPSVLVISYPMFNRMTLSTDPSLLTMKGILLNKPTIVVLDEGHNARNPLSQVQRQLMAIKTPLRVLLSGTLFQNNFEELYTCLNLARSGFVNTFAKIAGLKFNMQQETELQNGVENERTIAEWKERAAKAVESQAKKLFIEEIGNKIDKGQLANSTPEYAQGLERLRRLTTPFVHHYAGGVLRVLPPLRDFTIVLQPAALQEKMIRKLNDRMKEKTMLEREGLLSFVCIHPSLLSQHNVGKTFTDLLSPEEMAQAASNDPAAGVKTRFVMNLIEKLRHRGGQEEKMLIFCMNLNPLSLLENMLKTKFGWIREREVLHIDGKVTPDERQSIIERFNDPHGRVRALLLSTKACGEGITLTGASRVIFMDVLWNPAVLRQAIHRAFRLGQSKVVHVYRLVVTDCFEEDKYKRMVLKDLKSQTIFCASDENHEKLENSNGEVCGPPQHDFWEVKKQSSKDPVLNELERLDGELDQPAFKHVFRHGGLFDVEYDGDPEGKGANATEWLRNQKVDIPDSYDLDGGIGSDTPESYDMDGTFGSYDTDTEDSSSDGDNGDF